MVDFQWIAGDGGFAAGRDAGAASCAHALAANRNEALSAITMRPGVVNVRLDMRAL